MVRREDLIDWREFSFVLSDRPAYRFLFILPSEIWYDYKRWKWTAVAQWLRCCATNRKVAGSIQASVTRFFIDIKSFRSHYGPGVDWAFNRNKYQEYFLGVKAAGAQGWQPPSCAVVTKSENLNLLEPSGPLQDFTCFYKRGKAAHLLLNLQNKTEKVQQ